MVKIVGISVEFDDGQTIVLSQEKIASILDVIKAVKSLAAGN